MTNLANMTPVEIDTILAPMWEKQAEKQAEIAAKKKSIAERNELIQLVMEQKLNHVKVRRARIKTPADGIQLYRRLTMAYEELEWLTDELKRLELESLPYENEYVRRGGWTRVFLAQSHDGHAHRGQNCSTCHRGEERTRFVWLVEYSGKPEAEIVADAGERACTVCYPSAPVNVLKQKTKMFTPQEREAQQAREEREIERARKAEAAKAKGITNPDGTPLKDKSGSTIKTERTAQIEATDAIYDAERCFDRLVLEPLFEAHEGLREADIFLTVSDERARREREYAERLVAALAHKQDRDTEEVWAELLKKAEAKAKRNSKASLGNVYRLMRGLPVFQAYAEAARAKGLEPWNPHNK